MIHIRVPATSANMGSGFDSIGIALELYNHLWFEEMEERGVQITIKREQALPIPTDRSNLIYRTMVDFYADMGKVMPGVRMIQEDYIPLTRGLGSSAACIVAGLLAANVMSGADLPLEELAQIAAKIEGHPDNSNPALLGGMVVGALGEQQMNFVKVNVPKKLRFAVMIPDFPVPTEESRRVLPEKVSRQDAIFNSSRAGLLVASMMTGQIQNLETAMDDRLHQPYRKLLIPEMDRVFRAAKGYGAKAAYLSGAGSTLIAVVTEEQTHHFEEQMKAFLDAIPHEWTLMMLKPDLEGAKILA